MQSHLLMDMEIPFMDHVRHSLMIDRNKDVIIDKLLNLTLEIICLLSGEDYVFVRKSGDRCAAEKRGRRASERYREAQSLITGGSPPITEETPTQKTPKPAKNLPRDIELPIKSEDAEVAAWDYLLQQADAAVVVGGLELHDSADSAASLQGPRVNGLQDHTDLRLDYISGSSPRKCRSPRCSEECSMQECEVEPSGEGRFPQQCKEEEDMAIPDDLGSGGDDFADGQEQGRDPLCSEEEKEMIAQEYQADARSGVYQQPCKEEANPDYITAGPAVSPLTAIHPCSPAPDHFPNHSDPAACQESQCTNNLFFCSICGVRSSSETTFAAHQRFHTDEKSYDCTYCGKSFNQRSRLLSHKRKHTGEKPFSCPVCGRCFAERSALVTHQRIHSGEKPFNCTECARSFVQRSSLVKHQRIHTGERPFVCTQCGRCFSQSSNLVRHQRILHQFL